MASSKTELLLRYLSKKRFVRITGDFYEQGISTYGYVFGVSEELVLLQRVDDFIFDGFVVLRRADITNIRSGKWESAMDKLLKSEGSFAKFYGGSPIPEFQGFYDIFKILKSAGFHVIIEGKDSTLYLIGPIARVLQKSVSVTFYDPAGVLENSPSKAEYAKISFLTFGDRYTTTFKKYVRTRAAE